MVIDTMDPGFDNVIGIVGGMGPEAGLMLFNSILSHTRATSDQEHISVILMSFPSHIVDRTEFLEGKECVNPAFSVAQIIHKLEITGASVVGIACNTIYAPRIFDALLEELDRIMCKVKLLHMPAETCRYVKSTHPQAKRVGLLSTNGTYKYGEYRGLLEKQGYEVIVPGIEFQTEVIHRMIYDRKFGLKANAGIITPEASELM
ncbi:MAG: amino acid racemase, partial [Chitinophagaceae bacterium]